MNPQTLARAMRMARPNYREDLQYKQLEMMFNQINELEKAAFARACMADLGQLWQREWKRRYVAST